MKAQKQQEELVPIKFPGGKFALNPDSESVKAAVDQLYSTATGSAIPLRGQTTQRESQFSKHCAGGHGEAQLLSVKGAPCTCDSSFLGHFTQCLGKTKSDLGEYIKHGWSEAPDDYTTRAYSDHLNAQLFYQHAALVAEILFMANSKLYDTLAPRLTDVPDSAYGWTIHTFRTVHGRAERVSQHGLGPLVQQIHSSQVLYMERFAVSIEMETTFAKSKVGTGAWYEAAVSAGRQMFESARALIIVQYHSASSASRRPQTIDEYYNSRSAGMCIAQCQHPNPVGKLVGHLNSKLNDNHASPLGRYYLVSPETLATCYTNNSLTTRADVAGPGRAIANRESFDDVMITTQEGAKLIALRSLVMWNGIEDPLARPMELSGGILLGAVSLNPSTFARSRDACVGTKEGPRVVAFKDALANCLFWEHGVPGVCIAAPNGRPHIFPRHPAVANDTFAGPIRWLEERHPDIAPGFKRLVVKTLRKISADNGNTVPARLRGIDGNIAIAGDGWHTDQDDDHVWDTYTRSNLSRLVCSDYNDYDIPLPFLILAKRQHIVAAECPMGATGKPIALAAKGGEAVFQDTRANVRSLDLFQEMVAATMDKRGVVDAPGARIVAPLRPHAAPYIGEGVKFLTDVAQFAPDTFNYGGDLICIPVEIGFDTRNTCFAPLNIALEKFLSVGDDQTANGYVSSDLMNNILTLTRLSHARHIGRSTDSPRLDYDLVIQLEPTLRRDHNDEFSLLWDGPCMPAAAMFSNGAHINRYSGMPFDALPEFGIFTRY